MNTKASALGSTRFLEVTLEGARQALILTDSGPASQASVRSRVSDTIWTEESGYPVIAEVGVGRVNIEETKPARRILVADDQEANRMLAAAMLGRLGYTADTVTNGMQAVHATASFAYDAVLMDCRMPEMDGFRATEEIRRRERSVPRTPIIALTADATEDDRERCLRAGMDDYLSKPVSFEALAEVLRRWIPSAGEPMTARTPIEAAPIEETVGPAEPLLDPAVIADLRDLGRRRGEQWISEWVGSLLQGAQSNLDGLGRALEEQDMDALEDRSHSLGGIIATVGAGGIRRLCGRLKEMASQHQLQAVRETLEQIRAEFERVRAALGREFAPSAEKAAETEQGPSS